MLKFLKHVAICSVGFCLSFAAGSYLFIIGTYYYTGIDLMPGAF